MAFATTIELTLNWRPLRSEETRWAQALLDAAGRWIRRQRPDIAADDPDAKLVSIAVVRSALIPGPHTGYSSYSSTLGPRAKSGTLTDRKSVV